MIDAVKKMRYHTFMNQKEIKKHQSLSSIRLLKIMSCLSEKRNPVRLTDLAKELDMTQPTILRYLSALMTEGYVRQDPVSGGYHMTWKILKLAGNVQHNISLQSIVHPFLNALSGELGVGMLLATERNDSLVYIDLVVPPDSIETFLRIGRDAPLHCASSGKIMLSAMTEERRDALLQAKGMAPLTEHSITSREALDKELQRIRDTGYALDNEECELGHRCVSVPLRDYSGGVIAAISAFESVRILTDEQIQTTFLPALKQTAAEISYCLGFKA